MVQLIDKDAVVAEIERLQDAIKATAIDDRISKEQAEAYKVCVKLRFFVEDTLEVKEVQEEPISEYLEEEIQKNIHNHFFDLNGIAIAGTSVYATVDDMVYIAKHFANWQKEQMMKDAIDTTIKQGCIELGILIKGLDKGKFSFGDKVKVIIIKSE